MPKLEDIWYQLTNTAYISSQPGIAQRFKAPQAPRSDTDPRYNGQPWYKGKDFAQVDPTQKAIQQPLVKGKR